MIKNLKSKNYEQKFSFIKILLNSLHNFSYFTYLLYVSFLILILIYSLGIYNIIIFFLKLKKKNFE